VKLFVVKMNRWGDDELHSYVEGVYDDIELAKKWGQAEKDFRGGKYEAEIVEFELNNTDCPPLDD
jgi:hypothetical protein